jgi:hypothetical protein
VTKTNGPGDSDSTAKITADPALLYVNDCRAVEFTSSSTLGCFVSAQFDGSINLLQVVQPNTPPGKSDVSSVTLQIPSTLTATPGYKEIVVQVRAPNTPGGTCPTVGATKPVRIGILVVGNTVNRQ